MAVQKQSVKYMTDDEIQEIYYVKYYKASGADEIETAKVISNKNPRGVQSLRGILFLYAHF